MLLVQGGGNLQPEVEQQPTPPSASEAINNPRSGGNQQPLGDQQPATRQSTVQAVRCGLHSRRRGQQNAGAGMANLGPTGANVPGSGTPGDASCCSPPARLD